MKSVLFFAVLNPGAQASLETWVNCTSSSNSSISLKVMRDSAPGSSDASTTAVLSESGATPMNLYFFDGNWEETGQIGFTANQQQSGSNDVSTMFGVPMQGYGALLEKNSETCGWNICAVIYNNNQRIAVLDTCQ
jgi:hypothetical protein